MKFSAIYTEFVFDFRKNLTFVDNTQNEIFHTLIMHGMNFDIYR
jgi:hypothetical protein